MVTVKRRSDEGADQVRVMTVHGAKGLEAPIVILPDTAVTQDSMERPGRWCGSRTGGRPGAPARDACPPALADAEARRRRTVRLESRRLLYVALTRARQWLIVCGAGQPATGSGSGESWHDLVGAAMRGLGPATEPGPLGDVRVLDASLAGRGAAPAPAVARRAAAPAWLGARPPRPAPAPLLLSPSLLGGERDARRRGDRRARRGRARARHRGAPAARAPARLPAGGPPRPRRAPAARARRPRGAARRGRARARRARRSPRVFDPGGLAEVDVAAPVPGRADLRIAGRIDRLVVGDRAVLAIDFKSNRVVPDAAERVPEGILRQLGAYRAALVPLWPDRPVEVAVLWTRAARLMPVPAGARRRRLRPGDP